MGRTVLFGQKSKQFSAGILINLSSRISIVIIRILWGVISILYVIQLESIHVGLEEIECTDVAKVNSVLLGILV